MAFTIFESGTKACAGEMNDNFSSVMYSVLMNRMENDNSISTYASWCCCNNNWGALLYKFEQMDSSIFSDVFSEKKTASWVHACAPAKALTVGVNTGKYCTICLDDTTSNLCNTYYLNLTNQEQNDFQICTNFLCWCTLCRPTYNCCCDIESYDITPNSVCLYSGWCQSNSCPNYKCGWICANNLNCNAGSIINISDYYNICLKICLPEPWFGTCTTITYNGDSTTNYCDVNCHDRVIKSIEYVYTCVSCYCFNLKKNTINDSNNVICSFNLTGTSNLMCHDLLIYMNYCLGRCSSGAAGMSRCTWWCYIGQKIASTKVVTNLKNYAVPKNAVMMVGTYDTPAGNTLSYNIYNQNNDLLLQNAEFDKPYNLSSTTDCSFYAVINQNVECNLCEPQKLYGYAFKFF